MGASNGKASHFASFGGSQSVDVDAHRCPRNPFRMRRANVKFLCRERGSKLKLKLNANESENENEYAIESEDGFVFYSACESV